MRTVQLQLRRPLRTAGAVVGLLLVIAAIVAVARNQSLLASAVASARSAPWSVIALLLGGALANMVASAAGLRVLLLRHGKVGAMDMQAVIAAATLINYAPLRPGLASRAAYHHIVHGIPVMATVTTLVQSLALATVGIGWLCAFAWAMRIDGGSGSRLAMAVAAAAPALGVIVASASPRGSLRRALAVAWLWRCVDMAAWAVRYHAAFAVTGISLSAGDAAVAAAGAGAANLVPLVGNGLGVREWLIGLMGSSMRLWTVDAGLAADIVNRAADLAVAVPLGLAALPYVASRLRRAGAPASRRDDVITVEATAVEPEGSPSGARGPSRSVPELPSSPGRLPGT